ncbi:227 kDa spindle- and centromere-associated protein [Pistacia vera]|uniref:227 kDa spindle- and centromere-associated protein n=1 Tax=Pistacia vera TaxID=55513 RepID=UPI001263C33C|nr:227 kDa spindle- and centromere-associated protein [Pistacia vera]
MELLKLSKFKLQLQALITEARHLRERERLATEQIQVLVQKQKQTEEEYSRKLQELQAELTSSNESRQKLDRQVSFLQNDNALLENKQKELKETINRLLQSRESFLNAYEESTCDMKRSIETRDRKLSVLYEKINSHLTLFDSIEKEAFSIKQLVDNAERLVSEKEEVVASLKSKMEKVSSFEKVFVEKISLLESKLKNDEDEFRRKDKLISELEAELEAAKVSNDCQSQIEELQKTVSAKDIVIQNLIFEKEALHLEVGSLGILLQRIHDAVANMNQEDKKVFHKMLVVKEECDMGTPNEDNRIVNVEQNSGERSPTKVSIIAAPDNRGSASPVCQEYKSCNIQLRENNNLNFCVSELACSPPESVSSEPESASNVLSISIHDGKDNCTVPGHHLDSECSKTQAEASKDAG